MFGLLFPQLIVLDFDPFDTDDDDDDDDWELDDDDWELEEDAPEPIVTAMQSLR